MLACCALLWRLCFVRPALRPARRSLTRFERTPHRLKLLLCVLVLLIFAARVLFFFVPTVLSGSSICSPRSVAHPSAGNRPMDVTATGGPCCRRSWCNCDQFADTGLDSKQRRRRAHRQFAPTVLSRGNFRYKVFLFPTLMRKQLCAAYWPFFEFLSSRHGNGRVSS